MFARVALAALALLARRARRRGDDRSSGSSARPASRPGWCASRPCRWSRSISPSTAAPARTSRTKPGVANLAADLLDEGAGDLDGKPSTSGWKTRRSSSASRSARDHFRGSLRTLNEHRDEAFDLLRLALTAPRFDAEAVERVRGQVLSALRRDTTNPEQHRQPPLVGDGVSRPSLWPREQRHAGNGAAHHAPTTCATMCAACSRATS